jgi:FkbM family methyltransferase
VGTTSIPFARQGFRVLAIEPVPSTFALLERNVHNNELDHWITVLLQAVGPTRGTLTMSLASHGSSLVVATTPTTGETADLINVPAATLPDLLRLGGVAQNEGIALVWSDTEGCEGYVIDTGRELWAQGVPLYAEINPVMIQRHFAISEFLDLAGTSFRTFVGRRELVAQPESATARPISELRDKLDSLGDALLLP